MRFEIIFAVALSFVASRSAIADPAETCARIGNDDTVRPYQASLRPGFVRAYKTLFPDAKGVVGDAILKAEGLFRCMDGKLLACFVGANLPCAKIVSRKNPAVDRYCAETGYADFVPLSVTGHDAAYTYRCAAGHAEIAGRQWTRDGRGFAAKLWAPMD